MIGLNRVSFPALGRVCADGYNLILEPNQGNSSWYICWVLSMRGASMCAFLKAFPRSKRHCKDLYICCVIFWHGWWKPRHSPTQEFWLGKRYWQKGRENIENFHSELLSNIWQIIISCHKYIFLFKMAWKLFFFFSIDKLHSLYNENSGWVTAVWVLESSNVTQQCRYASRSFYLGCCRCFFDYLWWQ